MQWLPHVFDGIISNIKSCFSDNSLKLVVSFWCFDPSLFPSDDSSLSDYGNDQLKTLVEFYRNEKTTTFEGTTYMPPPLTDGVEVCTEWRGGGGGTPSVPPPLLPPPPPPPSVYILLRYRLSKFQKYLFQVTIPEP